MPADLLDHRQDRAPDGGPYYVETPENLQDFTGLAEPYNTITASFFVLIVLFWAYRLRGRYSAYPFLTACLPLLLVGGIGGTLYHGLRNWMGYFLMDVIPIYLLGLVIAVYFWFRLGPKISHLFGLLGVMALLQMLGHWQLPRQWAINLSYAMLALLILTPLVVVVVRTKMVHAGWLITAVLSFAIAWLCRIADTWRPPLLPMGTHWLWHTFGALTTALLAEYLYLVSPLNLRPGPADVAPKPP
jgi:hypothetical protein